MRYITVVFSQVLIILIYYPLLPYSKDQTLLGVVVVTDTSTQFSFKFWTKILTYTGINNYIIRISYKATIIIRYDKIIMVV